MRIVSAIDRPIADEHVIGVDPPLMPELPGVWRRRINPFTGRSLSDRALTAEQEARAGIQRLRGQSVTAGILAGLDLLLEPGALGGSPGTARFQLLPGSGLTQSGEDLVVSSARSIAFADLPVRARVDVLDAIAAGAPAPAAPAGPPPPPGPDAQPGGALIGLLPQMPRRMGAALGGLIAAAAADALPRVAVLVAEPVTATILARARDTCAPDPRDDPFDDLQRIDGCRLALDFWPAEMTARTGGPDYSLPTADAGLRNRLAYRVFGIERAMLPGEIHPWEQLGLPLALVAFNPDWTLAFVDRASVVRLGGRPNPRTPLVPQSGTPILWQARVAQFVEQLTALPDLMPATLRAAFRQLPPVGFLPAGVIDLHTRRQSFFPVGFGLSIAPIPLEQVDLVVGESAALLPINLDVLDEIELLAPVPERLYEPGLLETATVDPAFAGAMTRYTGDRTGWLVRRELVRRRRDLLFDAATGKRPSWPAADARPEEVLPNPAVRAPATCTRVREVAAVANGGPRVLRLLGAGSPLEVAKGDTVYLWVKVADAAGLTGFSLRLGAGSRSDGSGDFSAGVFWGADDALPGFAGLPGAAALRAGDLPATGQWTRLDIAADRAWTEAGGALAGLAINGLDIAQRGGTVQYGPAGKVGAGGFETVWVADDAPPGSALFDSSVPTTGWPFVPAGFDPAPVEDDFGTVETAGVRGGAAVANLRARWPQPFLAADLAGLDAAGADGVVQAIDARLKATNDAVDLGFVRARADIYRVRQYILGGDAASRLVTSPSLADLAVRAESARAKNLDISAYLKTAYQTDFRRNPDAPLDLQPKRPAGQPLQAAPIDTRRLTTESAFLAAPNFAMMRTTATTRTFAAGAATATADSPVFAPAADPVAAAAAMASQFALQSPFFSIAGMQADITGQRRRFDISDIQFQAPLPSAVERTASVAERLLPSPAVEAHGYALAGKLAVIGAISGLIGTAGGGATRPPGIALGDLPAPGYNYRPPADPPAGRTKNTIADVIQDLQKPASAREYDDVDALADTVARHEADYFTASVKALDNTIALMRLVESRIDLYNRLVTDAREVRDELIGHLQGIDARLRTIGIALEEARHDVGVATALLAEEQARVDALNARRAAILAANAKVVLFRRARRAGRVLTAPTMQASAALDEAPAAACLQEHEAAPEEIRSYVSLLRDAPAGWFPAVKVRFELIDRLEAARAALAAAQLRAATPPFLLFGTIAAEGAPRMLRAVGAVMTAQRAALEDRRFAAMQLDLGAIAVATLANVRRVLADRASMADLIAGDHNRPALARAAAAEIETIGQVAACLHDSFGETPPLLRLQWAELLSEFDQPAPLAALAGLPGWSGLPIELRRTQQGFVDWLFGRVDGDVAAAVTAINELVRVCLLMAAHAPVDRIIPARLIAPAPARIGGRLSLVIDASLVRIGMTALIRDGDASVIAHAVVEDIGDGVAHTRITKTFRAVETITQAARIDLTDLPVG